MSGIVSVMRNGAFELRTVTTGNEGKTAAALDDAADAALVLLEAAKHVALWMDDIPARQWLREAIERAEGNRQ